MRYSRKPNEKWKVVDLFCGAGASSIGFIQAGCKIVYALDKDRVACRLYRRNINHRTIKRKDVLDVTFTDLPPADIWTGWFPYTDILNYKKLGESSKKKNMLYQLFRLYDLSKYKPFVFVMEVARNSLPYLMLVEEEFLKRGFHMSVICYNAMYFGVPHNREKVFVVGYRVIGTKMEHVPLILPSQNTDAHVGTMQDIRVYMKKEEFKNYKYKIQAYTRRKKGKPNNKEFYVLGLIQEQNVYQDLRRLFSFDGICPTLQGELRKVFKVQDKTYIRMLHPREYARLCGYPDDFVINVKRDEAYKVFAGSSVIPVVEVVGKAIKDYLDKWYQVDKECFVDG